MATIRKWAEAGISLDKIAVISTEIEKYWPVLQFYLDEEGLSYKKDSVSGLNSLGLVQHLLAGLKNISQEVSWDSLEKAFFSKESAIPYKFEQFKALFYQLYDQDDLSRDQKIKDLFYRKVDFNQEINREEFLSFLLKIWVDLPPAENKNDLFKIIFKDFLAQSLNVRIKFSRWVQFLKNRLAHKEVINQQNGHDGLSILPLMSAQMIEVSHRVYIGLNDEYYHKKQNSLMSLHDSVALRTQFDLAVDYSEESYLDFNLRWQALSNTHNTFYTSAHLSFSSDTLNASLFFIENSPVSEVVNPAPTRIDELQRQLLQSVDGAEIHRFNESISGERLLQDITGYQAIIPSDVFRTLSVSDAENYGQCSFKLLAAKGFRLKVLPQVALDLDPRQKGTLVHALFERCIQLMSAEEYNVEKVTEFLEQKRSELGIYQQQENHWKIQKNKLLQLAQKFYQFELARIKSFYIETEKKIEMYFDLEKSEFTLDRPENSFTFKVRLDRIDKHKTKQYSILYDYKSSDYQVSNFSRWLSDQQFQMLLYMIALELTENIQKVHHPVKAALYYQYKTFDLKKGLIDESIAVSDFSLTKRNKSLISEDKKNELKEKFVLDITKVLKRLSAGEFSTQPSDLDICKKCDWRKLCRAKHLM